jgi:hypothetical protein
MRQGLVALTLAGSLCGANSGRAEIIRAQDMVRGITTTRTQCAMTPHTVWLTVYGRDFCVRYYISTVGGNGRRPVVFLEGDRLGPRDPQNTTWTDPSKFIDINTADLQERAVSFSLMGRTTAIYIGRIGVEGTSGNHADRHTVLELQLVNTALDALKQRYGFEGFHLAGQSGGSLLIGGLIGLRADIACAVAGSGRLGPRRSFRPEDPARSGISPIDYIPAALQNPSLRLYLVTAPADQKVPVDQQVSFAEAMRRAGRQILQFFVEATDKDRHGVTDYTRLVVAGCVLGRSDEEIARAVETILKRNAEYNKRRRKEIEAQASNGAAGRDVPGAGSAPAASKPAATRGL